VVVARLGRGKEATAVTVEKNIWKREENPMGKVRCSLSASLDGWIADTTDGVSEVFAWMGSAMEHFLLVEGNQINQVGAVIISSLQQMPKKRLAGEQKKGKQRRRDESLCHLRGRPDQPGGAGSSALYPKGGKDG